MKKQSSRQWYMHSVVWTLNSVYTPGTHIQSCWIYLRDLCNLSLNRFVKVYFFHCCCCFDAATATKKRTAKRKIIVNKIVFEMHEFRLVRCRSILRLFTRIFVYLYIYISRTDDLFFCLVSGIELKLRHTQLTSSRD